MIYPALPVTILGFKKLDPSSAHTFGEYWCLIVPKTFPPPRPPFDAICPDQTICVSRFRSYTQIHKYELIAAYKSGFFTLGPWGASLPPRLAMSDRSALSVGLTTSRQDASGWTVETQAGLNESHISADWSTRLLGLKLKFGVAGSAAEINAFVDAEGRVTQNIRTGLNVQLEYFGGIGMRVRWVFALPYRYEAILTTGSTDWDRRFRCRSSWRMILILTFWRERRSYLPRVIWRCITTISNLGRSAV